MKILANDDKDSYKKFDWNSPLPYVYVVEAKGTHFYKIGYTGRLEDRLDELQVGCPNDLKLIIASPRGNAKDLEKLLHKKFEGKHIRGEWFDLCKEDLELINNLLFEDIEIADIVSKREYIDCVR